MVFQNYALYPHMTVYQNMSFGLENRKMIKKEIEERVLAAAKILDIENLLDRKPKAMSGGQRQRVALGRAIVREPAVFLLDEPLSNLDAKLRTSMRTEIIKLHKRLKTTFIYVTHDQVEAMTMGDRIVVMKDGVVQQIGIPQELYDHPYNQFVAGFIGTPQMNFLDVVVKKDSLGWCLVLANNAPNSCIRLDETTLDLESYINRNIVLGIRPEHIAISNEGEIVATLEVVESLGSESYIYLDCLGRQIIVKTNEATDLKAEEYTKLIFDKSKIHLFEKESGLAIC